MSMNEHKLKQEHSYYYIRAVALPTAISNSTAAIIIVHLIAPMGTSEFDV